jgi:hypothetical protein
MTSRVPLVPESVRAASHQITLLAVRELTLSPPACLKVVPVVLKISNAVYADIKHLWRDIDELALGIGGLNFGLWGDHLAVTPRAPNTLLAIDLALAWVTLVYLLVALV